MIKNNSISYWTESRKPVYSFLVSLPIIVLYEIGIFIINSDDIVVIRNGADVLIKNLLELSGIIGIQSSGIILFIGFIFIFLFNLKTISNTDFKKDYFPIMIIESFLWGVFLFFAMSFIQKTYFSFPSNNLWFSQIVMSLGAGIYEEIIFRFILISLLAKVIIFLFGWNKTISRFYGIIISAALFSVFHFIGPYSDLPDLTLFVVRFLGGIFLGYLFILRGFGITSYTHCIYNLIVVVSLTTGYV